MARRPALRQIAGVEIPPESARSLAPREHGAYGQLAFPLLCALALGRPSWAGALSCVAFAALFAAHEPALVLAGKRGARARQIGGRRARKVLAAWLALGLAAGLGAAAVGGVPAEDQDPG